MSICARLLLLATVALLPACGDSDPSNVAGSYTISVTNRGNGCKFANWTEGASTQGIMATVSQEGSTVSVSFSGGTATFLDFAFGSHVMSGDVSGSSIDATLFGMRQLTMGGCSYTINGVMDGHLLGDTLTGELDYTSKTNGHPDCTAMMIERCHSIQAFNGTRPPPAN